MCQLNTISFMITIRCLKENPTFYSVFYFSSPKMRRKWILEPDVKVFGQEESNCFLNDIIHVLIKVGTSIWNYYFDGWEKKILI